MANLGFPKLCQAGSENNNRPPSRGSGGRLDRSCVDESHSRAFELSDAAAAARPRVSLNSHPAFFRLCVPMTRFAHLVAVHAGALLSHDSPHRPVHSVVWGIHRFPWWLFLELICARAPMCAYACVHVCLCVCIGHMSQCGSEQSLHAVRHLEQIYSIYPFDGATPPPQKKKFRAFFHTSKCIVLH